MDYTYRAVFNQQVWDWFVHDIQSCFRASISAQNAVEGKGGQNFPAALVTLVMIEFCAGFYVGKVEASIDDIVQFIVRYLGRHDNRFADGEFAKKFYKVFRHGLAHAWSPKGSGIAMDFRSDEVLHKDGAENDIPILNVPPFFQLVCNALSDYETDLGVNKELNLKFIKRLKAIHKMDSNAANDLIQLY